MHIMSNVEKRKKLAAMLRGNDAMKNNMFIKLNRIALISIAVATLMACSSLTAFAAQTTSSETSQPVMEGDRVITEISSKLQMLFRTSDVVGRIGGDEFIVFLRDISTDHLIAEKAKAIGEIFRNTHEGKQLDYKISGSIGIALYPADGTTYQELFPKADLALYRAKNLGKDCYAFYSDELHSNL